VVIKSDMQKEYETKLPGLANTAAAHWELAEWCKDVGLLAERKRHLQTVLSLEPDHDPARVALGFERIGSDWMTTEERMLSEGYVRAGGFWKTPQQLELEVANRENELAVKRMRRDILMWFEQLSGSKRDRALQSLLAIRDVRAVPALAEILGSTERSQEQRMLCMDILGRMPPGLASGVMIKLAMDERDAELRDRALDEVVRMKASGVASYFISQLEHKDNKRVNRAAACLARLEDPDSTLHLINALVTTHEYILMPSNGGGLSFNSSGGFSAGGKPQRKKQDHTNSGVLTALTTLHAGTNHQYDEAAWRKWYVSEFTTTKVDLRRDE
jgi:hypothetical protein